MRIFVYGSLKKGYWNHNLIDRAKLVGFASLDGSHVLLDHGFPVCVPMSSGRAVVTGEVYEVNLTQLQTLDRLEGEGHMYHRVKAKITYEDGTKGEVWIYMGDAKRWRGAPIGVQWISGEKITYKE
jgi:gamma-glutamylaminecyclotransferase